MSYNPLYAYQFTGPASCEQVLGPADDYEGTLDVDAQDVVQAFVFPQPTCHPKIWRIRIYINYYTTGTRKSDDIFLEAVDNDGLISTQSYEFQAGDFGGSDANHKQLYLHLTDAAWKDWDIIEDRLRVQCRGHRVGGADHITCKIDALWIEVDYTPNYIMTRFEASTAYELIMKDGVFSFTINPHPRAGWHMDPGNEIFKHRGAFQFSTSPLPNDCVVKTARLFICCHNDLSTYEEFDTWGFRYNHASPPVEADWDAITPLNTSSPQYLGNLHNSATIQPGNYYPASGLPVPVNWLNRAALTKFIIKTSTEGNADLAPKDFTYKWAFISWRGGRTYSKAVLLIEYLPKPDQPSVDIECYERKIAIQARRKLGQQYIYRVRQGLQERMYYYTPTNPQTVDQQAWRAVFTTAVAAALALTDQQKAPYIQKAKRYPGQTWFTMFMKNELWAQSH